MIPITSHCIILNEAIPVHKVSHITKITGEKNLILKLKLLNQQVGNQRIGQKPQKHRLKSREFISGPADGEIKRQIESRNSDKEGRSKSRDELLTIR